MGLPAGRVQEGRFCQLCGAPLSYAWHQYGQLGSYSCPDCDFSRQQPRFSARNVSISSEGVSFDASDSQSASSEKDGSGSGCGGVPSRVRVGWGGAYMVYNLLAAWAASSLAGVDPASFQLAVDEFKADNGRLQRFVVGGRAVTLNLAKNPTGFNQNIFLLAQRDCPKLVYIVINDDYNDGKDVSWLWDVDFELLAQDPSVRAFAVGGHRANDMQVRLKYAGATAEIAESVSQALEYASDLPPEGEAFVLTNYSALWPARDELTKLEAAR
jgi:UDP-N-acetylmuramyl tripeptide synthase